MPTIMANRQAIDRRAAVEMLLRQRGSLLAVTGLGSPTYDVFASGDHDGNLYLWGAMGGAALVALGLAQAQRHRPVVAITGDGEQLMGLGGLATIAVSGVRNLTVVVLDNGLYGETGGQLSHTGLGIELAAVARATGFAFTETIDSLERIEAVRDLLHDTDMGPRFLSISIENRDVPRSLPMRDGVAIKNRFRAHLGLAPN